MTSTADREVSMTGPREKGTADGSDFDWSTGPPGFGGVEDGPRARPRDLLRYLRAQRAPLLVALTLGLAAAGLSLVQPLLVMRVVNGIGGDISWLVAALVALFLAEAAISGVQSFLLQRTGEAMVFGVRQRLIRQVLHLPVREHDRLRSGDLLSRTGTDTTLLREVVSSGVVEAITGVVGLVGSVALMLWLDWRMFLLVLATVTVAILLVSLALMGIRRASELAQDRVGAMTADLDRVLGAFRTVLASRAQQREVDRISARADEAYRAGVRAAKLDAVVGPTMSLAANGSFLFVLGVGGARVANGTMELGELVAFLLYLMMLVMPLIMILQAATTVQRGLGALQRIQDTLALETEPPDEQPARHSTVDSPAAAELRLDAVSFGYTEERPVLHEVSFTVPPYARAALVGPSGAGKSTIFALVERFYDPEAGTIRLGERDISTMGLGELRGQIGYVQQEAPILWGSLRSNLTYAAPAATEAEIAEVLRMTNLTTLVEELPDGLDSEVGDRGVLLSGGQRQRVAIARALLCRPSLLLMDEPTAQLDAANEEALAATVRQVARHCTVLVIAHRISTVRDADLIVVLDDGRVVDTGTHDDLVVSSPLYRRFAGQLVPPTT
ncbi:MULTISPECIES: ABC transporter ATP-binding protein [unclassified Crossiella]|uniref:ABC transporter ATP-binding protein n=1 Tax=unclassified Crossiella TaxID=2620835 RepID=UPI001FFF8E0D|nr:MULTISPECIES: ABC transporter ATP-binding protein [unclassified Crossiella]MCK2239256.1 ABC transporter ATP-binding protein/permease [Crossiella sp. S99.2]MCK2251174.1 ABC transporter ATP-binding protein/permease [Crossiella sp. S99.1]